MERRLVATQIMREFDPHHHLKYKGEKMKEQIVYLLGMIERMPENPMKFNTWLGFIQGSLWTLGIREIDQVREDNRVSVQNGLQKAKEVLKHKLGTL